MYGLCVVVEEGGRGELLWCGGREVYGVEVEVVVVCGRV